MLPVETMLALFPGGTEVCRTGRFAALRLRPFTLAHAAALEAWGCDLGANLDESRSLIAAWLLSKRPPEVASAMLDMERSAKEAGRWVRGKAKCVARISKAVNGHIVAAFKTYVAPKKDGGCAYSAPRGFGWPLEIVEALCGEYGWSLDDALATPVATALALVSVARQRHGGENGGPDYYERIMIREINAMQETKAK